MEWGSTTLAFSGLGAAALATSLVKLKRRLELSKAKHRSLTGHARMSRRVASLLPFYEYDEARFFRSDDPPETIAAQRQAGFMRLSAHFKERFAEDARSDRRGGRRRFRSAVHRRLSGAVPIQPHRAPALAARLVPAIVRRRDGDRPRRQHVLRPHRIVRRQSVRQRFLQDLHGARPRPGPRPWPGARLVSSGGRRQRPALERDLRSRRSVVPHVGHRGGHAGGAARALSHRAGRTWCASAAPITAGGATCSRASAIRCRRATPIR